MKNSSFYLLLDGFKVRNIRELREHFDTAALVGYLYGGSLVKWLYEVDELEIVKRVRMFDGSEDAGLMLQHVFGVNPDIKYEPSPVLDAPMPISFTFEGTAASSFGSSFNSSFGSSFGSSFNSSFSALFSSSFGAFTTSLNIGSYAAFAFAAGFTAGSFTGGSFTLGSGGFGFGWGRGRGGSGLYGSGGSFGSFSAALLKQGSFYYTASGAEITEQEYKRTMINLSSCPLNEYGYGIHIM